jgi:hypothetical protein
MKFESKKVNETRSIPLKTRGVSVVYSLVTDVVPVLIEFEINFQ